MPKVQAQDRYYTDARFNLAKVEASLGKWEAAASYSCIAAMHGQRTAKETEAIGEYQKAVLSLLTALICESAWDSSRVSRPLAESQAEFKSALQRKPDLKIAKEAITAIEKRRTEMGK